MGVGASSLVYLSLSPPQHGSEKYAKAHLKKIK